MKVNLKFLAAQIVGVFILLFLTLFLAAGTLLWPAGWAFLILFLGFVIGLSLWLLKHNPDLLRERMGGVSRSDRKAVDNAFYLTANAAFAAWLIVMPLDAVRFRWSHVPVELRLAGLLLMLGSFLLFFLVFRENAYLSAAMRVQEERGQKVVSTGPYHYVRHPMYATFIIFFIGTTLFLGSWRGLIPGGVLALVISARAVAEERMLGQNLQGYKEYMSRVKFRIIPHIW